METPPDAAPRRYRITIRGRLSDRLASAFPGVALERRPGETVLSGSADASPLPELLERVSDLGLDAVSVMRTTDGDGERGARDAAVATALWAGDEAVFRALVQANHSALLGVAMACGCTRPGAREVVRRTWLTVLERLPDFDGRASLRAWVCGIATGIARTHAVHAPRAEGADRMEPVDAEDVLRQAIRRLPPPERLVVTLRDIERWPAGETCDALGMPEPTERRLLQRARSALCAARERDAAASGRMA